MEHPTLMEQLLALVPPPEAPLACTGEWGEVQANLGLASPLPRDFVALVSAYGVGAFCDHLHPFAPFFQDCPMVERVEGVLAADAELRELFPDEYPGPLHPAPGGLLPWATTVDGVELFWLKEGAPEAWPVVLFAPRGLDHERFDGGAVALLVRWLSGQLESSLLPREAAVPPFFEPHRELAFVEERLSESEQSFDERLAVVQELLAPVVSRGGVEVEGGGRQERFLGTAGRWKITYEQLYGHRLRVAHPPREEAKVRAKVKEIASALGVRLLDGV